MMFWVTALACLAAVTSAHQQEPAAYQRKMVGRMVWSKAEPGSSNNNLPEVFNNPDESFQMDYPLGSFLTLSFSASDAEGRTVTTKPDDANKLNLLQQLLRLAPAEDDNDDDDCNHPFRGWMCDKNKAKLGIASTTQLPSTDPPELTADWDGKDPCTHPFHSWLCPPKREKTGKSIYIPAVPSASKLVENQFVPVRETSTTIPTSPPTKKASGWDGADPCTHPFHSWLCNRSPPATTLPSLPQPGASNNEDVFFVPEVTTERTTTTTTTTRLPPILIRAMAPKLLWDEADSCSHPFHSWLCNPAPSARTTSPRPTTTTSPKPVIPEASNNADNFFIPEPSSTTTTKRPPPILIRSMMPVKAGWDEADSCSHPFHSWLCDPLRKRTTNAAPRTTTPKQLVPEASNFADKLLNPEANLVSTTTKPTTSILIPAMISSQKSSWSDDAKVCSHPFHSWLCAKPKASPNQIPEVVISSTPLADIRLPEASSNIKHEEALSSVPEIKSTGWEGADPCTHPFHSWLCNHPARKGRHDQPSLDDIIEAVEQFDPQRLPVQKDGR